ncbi:5-formyltetrahydrofolate cyclo-ligase [Vagococcus bubulae]|uniref:5-formyltetrahydrofolate cyclo-ligase n=1 Tax=Vagococcus bubulae TaxID=1977868 RepID=A0A429ZGA9_9ENTE|nr:5-formyltetrahydrofolate cyclo-ligase [Vagococcus bubulae]RST92707.1 5-formyltetrahydrofolate cyclo-ligase [Vagococcus bubulae]
MKQVIRQDILAKLKHLATQENKKQALEEDMLSRLYETNQWRQANVIATTYPMTHEFDTTKLMKQAFLEGKTIVIPKTKKRGEMDFYVYHEDIELELTSFGVYEPIDSQLYDKASIDLMIVPGVGFTQEGKRIGYGGGFYDRYLTDFKGSTISLVFDEQLLDELETEEHDKLVDVLICARGGTL